MDFKFDFFYIKAFHKRDFFTEIDRFFVVAINVFM